MGRYASSGFFFLGIALVGGAAAPPRLANGTTNVIAVAAGGQHTLALTSNGTVVAWGSDASHQCDVPSSASNVTAIAAGWAFSVALRNDGTVISLGRRLLRRNGRAIRFDQYSRQEHRGWRLSHTGGDPPANSPIPH